MAAPSTPGSSVTGELSQTKLLSVTTTIPARGKKRSASPALHTNNAIINNNNNNSSNNKRKKIQQTSGLNPTQTAVVDSDGQTADVSTLSAEPTTKPLPFKEPTFVHSGIGGAAAGKKNRTWKNLKQILAAEKALPWKISDPTYFNIDAPPSMKPFKKYSDISGLPANYTDPQTKLRFTSSEEFSYIRLLPTDVVTGYLTLRKASCIVP